MGFLENIHVNIVSVLAIIPEYHLIMNIYALLFVVVLYLFIKDLQKFRMQKEVNISLVMRGIAVCYCMSMFLVQSILLSSTALFSSFLSSSPSRQCGLFGFIFD